jgi:hypothetical protein
MIDITDIKIFLNGLGANLLILLFSVQDWDIVIRTICYVAVNGTAIYFMYLNHKKKK